MMRYKVHPFSLAAPPQFVDFPLDVEVDVGESVELICSAEGSPTPKVSWFRQDEGPVLPSGTTEIIDDLGSNTVHMKSKRMGPPMNPNGGRTTKQSAKVTFRSNEALYC